MTVGFAGAFDAGVLYVQWRAEGRRTAVLDVHVDNERAQAFYARQGWVPDPENPPEDGDHHLFLRYAVTGE